MRRNLGTLVGLLALCVPAVAANPGDRPPMLSDEQEAIVFSQQIVGLTQIISQQYVKEIPQDQLLVGALRGLYDAARQPFPPSVAESLRNAKTEKEYYAIVIDARRRVGSAPALAGTNALFASIGALSSVLDPHCLLVPSSAFQTANDYQAAFGFELDGDTASGARRRGPADESLRTYLTPPIPFRLAKVDPGSSAQRAGMKPGDVLTHVDGKAVTAESSAAIYRDMSLPPADPSNPAKYEFTLVRQGADHPLLLTVSKRSYVPESIFGVRREADNTWNFWLDDKEMVAYLRIGAIDGKTPEQVADALMTVRNAKGLILDLRWCPGGFLKQSAEIAGLLLSGGKIASVKYRQPDRQGQSEFRADGIGIQRVRFKEAPMVVLVDGETSGGGELIAAALQDNERAKVAGHRTLGKASIQSPVYLDGLPQWSFKLTAGTFLRPSGTNLQRFSDSKSADDWGVRPDEGFAIPLSDALGRRLKDWHHDYVLRPPNSREALPLDDPEADPQRNRAVRMLKQILQMK
jgi:C-terminal peptidase prc